MKAYQILTALAAVCTLLPLTGCSGGKQYEDHRPGSSKADHSSADTSAADSSAAETTAAAKNTTAATTKATTAATTRTTASSAASTEAVTAAAPMGPYDYYDLLQKELNNPKACRMSWLTGAYQGKGFYWQTEPNLPYTLFVFDKNGGKAIWNEEDGLPQFYSRPLDELNCFCNGNFYIQGVLASYEGESVLLRLDTEGKETARLEYDSSKIGASSILAIRAVSANGEIVLGCGKGAATELFLVDKDFRGIKQLKNLPRLSDFEFYNCTCGSRVYFTAGGYYLDCASGTFGTCRMPAGDAHAPSVGKYAFPAGMAYDMELDQTVSGFPISAGCNYYGGAHHLKLSLDWQEYTVPSDGSAYNPDDSCLKQTLGRDAHEFSYYVVPIDDEIYAVIFRGRIAVRSYQTGESKDLVTIPTM